MNSCARDMGWQSDIKKLTSLHACHIRSRTELKLGCEFIIISSFLAEYKYR
jgi:hypothetical protein